MAQDSHLTRTVETTVHLDAEPQKVIRAFLEDADLKGWWRVTRSLVEAKPGGTWCIAWDGFGENKTNHSWTGVIRELDERRLVIDPLVQNEPDRPILFGPLRLEVLAEAARRWNPADRAPPRLPARQALGLAARRGGSGVEARARGYDGLVRQAELTHRPVQVSRGPSSHAPTGQGTAPAPRLGHASREPAARNFFLSSATSRIRCICF